MTTKNDASQTLFRMVSLRNPQLTEIKIRNLGFIQRPKGSKGIFDAALNTNTSQTTKLDVMIKVAPNVNINGFKTEIEIESGTYGQLLIIGRKISKREILNVDEWMYTKKFYSQFIDSKSKEINKAGISELTILWDNLIYQVVTQKDFYVKEAISHILKAIHIGFAQSIEIDKEMIKINGDKPLEKALDGKIVLPKVLFMEDISDSSIPKNNDTEFSNSLSPIAVQRLTNEAKTDLLVNDALYNKESLTKLNTELKQLEKSYYKLKDKVYNEAYTEYRHENQSKIDEYEKIVNEIEVQNSKNDSNDISTKLNESLLNIEIPPFEFTYKSEINTDDLKSNLSPESLNLFLSLFSNKVSVQKTTSKSNPLVLAENQIQLDNEILEINDEIGSYNSAINEINNQIIAETETILQNTTLVQEQYVNLGGASIPVAQNSSRMPLAYAAIVSNSNFRSFLNFSFEVENTSWNVASVKIIADTDFGHFEETYNNIVVVNNKITIPPCLINKFKSYPTFKVEILFANGREAYGHITNIKNYNEVFTGMLQLKLVNNTPETKRKNFGIKRLGVADYLKVVQSVHAYVPGLVSNIENVMASELRHKSSVSREYSEITDTISKYQETEKVSDTSKTSRTDMQSEVAKEIDKQQSITGHTRFNYDTKVYKFEIGAEYANNTAQHDSTRQAVMKSQELTEKALDRVLTKISEERVQKIIKEYTETNVHEFDNRGIVTETNNPEAAQPKHITGVYRWIDIKYKNQIYNYGIRTMFEFMVPEPAKLHRLALNVAKGQILTAPIDPRKANDSLKMINPKTATKELLEYWAQFYKVELTPIKTTEKQSESTNYVFDYKGNLPIISTSFTVKSGYICKSINITSNFNRKNTKNSGAKVITQIGGAIQEQWANQQSGSFIFNFGNLNVTGPFVFTHSGYNLWGVDHALTLNLEINLEELEKWKTVSFDAIIKAYDAAYKTFQEEQAKLDEEQKKKEQEAKDKMGKFYRYMEQDVLKHNCIAYLLQDYLSPKTIGQNYTVGDKMENFAVALSDDLDKYAALAKFMEQAFEWEIMDYTFYPYYWANRDKWREMYVSDSMDPLFRSFLQSGLARVIVTVRPGFEAAVQFFLETGLIWNGGEVPVIGDPMYMSIVDEMRKTLGTPQGKYWITKLPTTLTILQDKSTGLPVEQPLPIYPEADPTNCENPSELVDKSSFQSRDISLNRSDKTESTLD